MIWRSKVSLTPKSKEAPAGQSIKVLSSRKKTITSPTPVLTGSFLLTTWPEGRNPVSKGDHSMKRFNFKTIIITIFWGVLFFILGTVAPTYAQKEQQPQAKDRQEQQQGNDQQEQKQQQEKSKEEPQQPQAKDQQEQHAKDQEKQPQQPQAKARQEQQPKVQQEQQAKDQQKPAKVQQQQEQAKGQLEHQVKDQHKQAKVQQPKAQQTQQPQQAAGLKKQQKQATQLSQKVQPVQKNEQRVVWQQHRASSWQTEHRTWLQRGGYNGYRIPEDHFHGYFGRDHGFRIYNLSLEIFGGHPRFQYEGYWFCVVDPWPEYWSAEWYENDDVYIDYVGGGYYMYNRRHPRDRIAITVYVS
jgi:hypothetical protein